MLYGRHNSDQTANLRNMRSVLQNNNSLLQKNNFINMGSQQFGPSTIVVSQQTQQQQ